MLQVPKSIKFWNRELTLTQHPDGKWAFSLFQLHPPGADEPEIFDTYDEAHQRLEDELFPLVGDWLSQHTVLEDSVYQAVLDGQKQLTITFALPEGQDL